MINLQNLKMFLRIFNVMDNNFKTYNNSCNIICSSVLYTVSNCFIRFLPDEDWSLSDIYYKIKQYTKLSNWLPELAGKLRIRFCLS